MKILVVAPKEPRPGPGVGWWNQEFLSLIRGQDLYGIARLSLPILASRVPARDRAVIVDENIDPIPFDEEADLVGITFHTPNALRAYEIGDEFRRRGVKVVMGGIHASVLPEEALAHADSVVIGEGDEVWPGVIEDHRRNSLQRIYRSEARPELAACPAPRWDLMQCHRYSNPTIQTTRGCPFNCEFCSIKAIWGNDFRCRPVDQVIHEVEQVRELGFPLVFFGDDNFTGNRDYACELLRELIPLGITYQNQMSIDVAEDDRLLGMLAASGCKRSIISLESVSNRNPRDMGKHASCRFEKYAGAIGKIQSYGIEVYGSFMLGCDNDDENVFEATERFIRDANLALAMFNILTPYPGTRLYDRLEREGRILHRNWSLYDSMHVCFRPKLMDPETLQQGFYRLYRRVYAYDSIFERMKNIWELWNRNNVRVFDRISPLLLNLNCNNTAYSYPQGQGECIRQ